MRTPFLLTRILLRFDTSDADVHGELSAITLTPDGSLWVGSDELQTVERLSLLEPNVYGARRSFYLGDFVRLPGDDGEVDIEGMDYADGYLWVTGSHSIKRKKPKGKSPAADIERLSVVRPEPNRYTLARIPVLNGELVPSCVHPEQPDQTLQAAALQHSNGSNVLLEALHNDAHMAPFMTIPNKENGLDIEGLAVRGNRLFLGLRGPVLAKWAIILECVVSQAHDGMLTLEPIGKDGQPYRKHFLDLSGLGVRELCFYEDDLIILAGPTMDLEGTMDIFRLYDALSLDEDSITPQDAERLETLFHLPFTIGTDHAEGLALMSALGQQGLLVAYDSPDPSRCPSEQAVFTDLFRLDV